jgi:hypothetical protein
LQFLDERGYAVDELAATNHKSSLIIAQKHLFTCLAPEHPLQSTRSSLVLPVMRALFPDDAWYPLLVRDVLYISSQVWSRLQVPFSSWPYPLFQNNTTCQAAVDDLYRAHPCCLDELCSEPLRRGFLKPDWSGGSEVAVGRLATLPLGRVTHTHNSVAR